MGVLQWRDHEILQVICPTCQSVFEGIAQASDQQLAWGCFRYFGLGATARLAPPPRWRDLAALGSSLRDGTDADRPFLQALF